MQRIIQTIEEYQMIVPGDTVVAGVSGGADSVCLLYVLSEYRKQVDFQIIVIHVEHGIRGEESLRDAGFTEELCERMKAPFRMEQICVQQKARECGLSVEEAGRKARYEIFEQERQKYKNGKIAVAHNQNDQAETVLWNLCRGTGLKGLGGIRPVRDHIIRPLLFTSRERIEQILVEAGLSWRTDRTNLTEAYTRNRIRLSILPEMNQTLNERSTEHIAKTAAHLWQVQAFIEEETDRAVQCCITVDRAKNGSQVKISLPEFANFPKLIRQELLRHGIEQCSGSLRDVGSVHIDALMELADMDCGKEVSLPANLRAVREKELIRIAKMDSGEYLDCDEVQAIQIGDSGIYHVPGWTISVEIIENDPSLFQKIYEEKTYTKWISCDTIKCKSMLRHRRTGDYLLVGKERGRKKLKDFFIDRKIPKDQRDKLWILADGAHILWIPGYRISEGAKVLPETKKVMKIQITEEKPCRKK